jgi:hypothetical protein
MSSRTHGWRIYLCNVHVSPTAVPSYPIFTQSLNNPSLLFLRDILYPCSHAFCEECSQSMTKGQCPTCRGEVKGWMPALSFDTIVWAAALQGCFEKDDAKYYLERREGCGETAATEEERGSILNSGEGGTMDGGMTNGLVSHTPALQPTANFIKTLPPMYLSVSNGNRNGLTAHLATSKIVASLPMMLYVLTEYFRITLVVILI